MRVLLDNNLSERLIPILAEQTWDVAHVRSLGLAAADDEVVMETARQDDRILISADTDFGALLATSHAAKPSVVLVRRVYDRRVEDLAAILLATSRTCKTTWQGCHRGYRRREHPRPQSSHRIARPSRGTDRGTRWACAQSGRCVERA